MRIHTFFDCSPRLSNQGELIRLWRDSWQNRGWECKILNPRTYAGHKYFRDYRRLVYPVTEEDLIERCRLMRWLALDAVGGGWISDYDVMNFGPYGNPPTMTKALQTESPFSSSYSSYFSLVYLRRKDAHSVVCSVLDGALSETRAFAENKIFPATRPKIHTEYDDQYPHWLKADTVDFSGFKDKPKVIEACGRSI